MSYEDALEAMRNRQVEPAPLQRLEEKRDARPELPAARFGVVSVVVAVAALGFVALCLRPAMQLDEPFGRLLPLVFALQGAALLPAVVLFMSLRWMKQPKLGPQLLCRAAWWSSLVVGLLASANYSQTPDKVAGAVIAFACALALWRSGERGLDVHEPDHPFAPVRFRGHLLLALVMAAADALTLAFSALLQLRVGMHGWSLLGTMTYAGPTMLAAAVMGIAVWGVYRLRAWALFLNLIANITIAYLAVGGDLNLSPSVSVMLAATAAVQSFIPVPILAVALGDRNAGQPLISRLRQGLIGTVLIVLPLLSSAMIWKRGGDGWVDGPGRAFVRGAPVAEPSIREKLDALDDDLRGRVFDGEPLFGADFSDANLAGASLRRVLIRKSSFDGADLRDADFSRADLAAGQDWQPSFEGVVVSGADFTGALVSRSTWSELAENGLDGVTCPDGTRAQLPDGCDGHLGHVPQDYRQVFEFSATSTRGSLRCGREGDATVAYADARDGVLWWRNERFARLADGTLVSPFTEIRMSDDGRWHVASELCGDNVLIPLERDPLSDPGASSPAGGPQ